LTYKGTIDRQIELIVRERKRLQNEMKKINGIIPCPTDSNFILFRQNRDAQFIWEFLLKNGILIKNLDRMKFLKNCLRVTVGKKEENSEFLEVLKRGLTI
jgi:histidinol-phosphate aminotransferase